ncbi:MAG TPA: GNAT family N-acetyltransferase [Dongiaceae bacterium]|jgi:ribosomal protein S18 acetylase RimI-like enzyme|nr:GNAT family N-acetyltransferase [Dongiaceae bacterium]
MDFVIRPYVASDRAAVIDALIGLQEHERAMHDTRLPGDGNTDVYFDRLLEELTAKAGGIFVAELAGRFAGIVAGFVEAYDVVLETSDSCIYGYCSDIYVAPEHRGTGLAQTLLDVLERHLAAQAPIARFRVNVLVVNRIACRAYERAGFVPYELMYERIVRRDRS